MSLDLHRGPGCSGDFGLGTPSADGYNRNEETLECQERAAAGSVRNSKLNGAAKESTRPSPSRPSPPKRTWALSSIRSLVVGQPDPLDHGFIAIGGAFGSSGSGCGSDRRFCRGQGTGHPVIISHNGEPYDFTRYRSTRSGPGYLVSVAFDSSHNSSRARVSRPVGVGANITSRTPSRLGSRSRESEKFPGFSGSLSVPVPGLSRALGMCIDSSR